MAMTAISVTNLPLRLCDYLYCSSWEMLELHTADDQRPSAVAGDGRKALVLINLAHKVHDWCQRNDLCYRITCEWRPWSSGLRHDETLQYPFVERVSIVFDHQEDLMLWRMAWQ